eukprot:contig_28400_g6979
MAATCVVQPIDLIKTRMQLASAGPTGVKPSYTNVAMAHAYDHRTVHRCRFAKKAAAGYDLPAHVGRSVGTPAEVALVRMTADGRLPVA